MNTSTIKKLLSCDLFSDFSLTELEAQLAPYRVSLKVYPAEHLIMLKGDVIDSLLIVLSGRLQAQIQGLNGKTLRVEVLKDFQPVASGILFSHDNRLPVSLYSETDIELLSIPKSAVLELCKSSTSFMLNFFTDMGDKISILAEKIRLYQFNTIRQKIAGYLLGLIGARNLVTVKLLHSKEVLAEVMGVTRPSLSREFSRLVREDLIEVSGKTIRIINRPGLEALLYEQDI